jgi:cellulose synthase operon protein C
VPNLRGSVFMAKRDLANARASFEKALQIDPQFYAAARNLAIIDLQEGNPQAARARYEQMLAKSPDNEALLLAYADLLSVSGASQDQARSAIDKAVAAHPASAQARLALVGYDMRRRDSKAAMAAAQAALSAIPNDPQLTEALGATQLASGELNQAVETFRNLVKLQPENPLALLRLAEAQVAIKDFPSAIASERKALAMKPDLPAALVALTKTYLLSGKADAAIAEAHRLQKEQPDKAMGYALEGELLSLQKKWPEAASAFGAAVSRQPSAMLITRQYAALQGAGKATDAAAMANKWMKEHPADPGIPLMLAEESQRRKDFPAAIAGYEKVIALDAGNVIALNNLAWVLTEKADPKGLEYAERAQHVAPFNPSILDTYGWALTRNGDAKRGVEMLRMATRLAPEQAEIRLHFAQALAAAGDKAGARQAIADLTKLDKASPIRIEAEKLQATL